MLYTPRFCGDGRKYNLNVESEAEFPRATRGWKRTQRLQVNIFTSSPALRGDGRMVLLALIPWVGFPPRIAGMEE